MWGLGRDFRIGVVWMFILDMYWGGDILMFREEFGVDFELLVVRVVGSVFWVRVVWVVGGDGVGWWGGYFSICVVIVFVG